MKRNSPERDLQVALFKWIRSHSDPIWHAIHASGNGNYKHPSTARKAKEEGLVSGVWDIFIPLPKNNFGGLYIECKSNSGRLTKEQKIFKETLENYYDFKVVRELEEAINIIEGWIND